MTVLHVASALIIHQRALLLCQGFDYEDLILPGGTIESGTTEQETLLRELTEELGNDVSTTPVTFEYFGSFTDEAVGCGETQVEVRCFLVSLRGQPRPSSEIKALVWYKLSDAYVLSPVLKNHIVPALLASNLL